MYFITGSDDDRLVVSPHNNCDVGYAKYICSSLSIYRHTTCYVQQDGAYLSSLPAFEASGAGDCPLQIAAVSLVTGPHSSASVWPFAG